MSASAQPSPAIPAPYQAAAVQMNSTNDLAANLKQARELIASAAAAGARLIGLPEYFAFLGPEAELKARAAEIAQSGAELLADCAAKHGVFIMGGAIRVPEDTDPDQVERVLNSARLFGPDGQERACYDKIHLFDVNVPDGIRYRESDYTVPGAPTPVSYSDAQLGTIGLTICYDLRFAELYGALAADHHADAIFAPAAFTAYTGEAHWELLVRTRAVENTCYIIAPAQTGLHYGKRSSFGHAMVVDPWAEVLADAGTEPGFALGTIDPERLQSVRNRVPTHSHRRLGR